MKPTPLIILILLSMLASCSSDKEEVNVRLTLKERERVDKAVSAHMDSIRPILQQTCSETFMDRVAVATDSIVQIRLEDEARLRARIPQFQK